MIKTLEPGLKSPEFNFPPPGTYFPLVIFHGYRAMKYLIGRIHARRMALAGQPNLAT